MSSLPSGAVSVAVVPCMVSFASGEFVPIPTFPLFKNGHRFCCSVVSGKKVHICSRCSYSTCGLKRKVIGCSRSSFEYLSPLLPARRAYCVWSSSPSPAMLPWSMAPWCLRYRRFRNICVWNIRPCYCTRKIVAFCRC